MESVTIRRSPIVLIRTFVLIEILGFICYSVAATLGNYKYDLYTRLSLSNVLSYATAKFLLLSGAQLVITIYAFLKWYYESYAIGPGAISHEWGVFFKKRKTVSLEKSMSMKMASGPLGKILHYGSIQIGNKTPKNSLRLADISYPQKNLEFIKKCSDAPAEKEPDIYRLLAENEHEQLEFKSSLRFDRKTSQVNHKLEQAAIKTVAGFLNSKGGQLVIGVDDSREPTGLENDYQTLKRPTSDGFENHFTQVFNSAIGPELRHFAKVRFHTIGGRDVCVVDVAPSAQPAYAKFDDVEHFFIRTGNVTTPLKLSEIESYTRSRWPRMS